MLNFVSGVADGITSQFSFTQESKEALSDLSAMGQFLMRAMRMTMMRDFITN